MTCSATNLQEQSIVVSGSGSPEPIDVTVRDEAATLSGNMKVELIDQVRIGHMVLP